MSLGNSMFLFSDKTGSLKVRIIDSRSTRLGIITLQVWENNKPYLLGESYFDSESAAWKEKPAMESKNMRAIMEKLNSILPQRYWDEKGQDFFQIISVI